MRRLPGTKAERRFNRRLAARRAARQETEPPKPHIEERRHEERRKVKMSPAEVEAWLKQNKFIGTDRRKGDRRQR